MDPLMHHQYQCFASITVKQIYYSSPATVSISATACDRCVLRQYIWLYLVIRLMDCTVVLFIKMQTLIYTHYSLLTTTHISLLTLLTLLTTHLAQTTTHTRTYIYIHAHRRWQKTHSHCTPPEVIFEVIRSLCKLNARWNRSHLLFTGKFAPPFTTTEPEHSPFSSSPPPSLPSGKVWPDFTTGIQCPWWMVDGGWCVCVSATLQLPMKPHPLALSLALARLVRYEAELDHRCIIQFGVQKVNQNILSPV